MLIFLLQVAVSFRHPSVHFTLLNDRAGRAPVVSSKHTPLLLSWYHSPPFSQQRRVVGSKLVVCVRVCVCALIQGPVHDRYWQGCALFSCLILLHCLVSAGCQLTEQDVKLYKCILAHFRHGSSLLRTVSLQTNIAFDF